jgi:hypothetical protein
MYFYRNKDRRLNVLDRYLMPLQSRLRTMKHICNELNINTYENSTQKMITIIQTPAELPPDKQYLRFCLESNFIELKDFLINHDKHLATGNTALENYIFDLSTI